MWYGIESGNTLKFHKLSTHKIINLLPSFSASHSLVGCGLLPLSTAAAVHINDKCDRALISR